ncbi:fimbrial biogenesis outer membrane usher protein [Salmonella enterica]|nr:fimbrial biogenesis outer membrane usher protein [Salmonella enterica]
MNRFITCLFVWGVSISFSCWGRVYTFDSTFVDGGNNVDVSLFNEGLQLPGQYYVSIFINGESVGSDELYFRLESHNGKEILSPCLNSEQLTQYGIDVNKYSGVITSIEQCADIWKIQQIDMQYDFNQQKLSLTVPSQALLPKTKGIASVQLWDDGIPALFMNYQTNMQQREYLGTVKSHDESYYAQLQPGLNIGSWRLRGASTWQSEQGWQRSYIYAERGFNTLKSRLTIGESYSEGSVFDSVPFTGGKVTSDESMLPYDQWSFAPVIRGIARTQARVEVKKNGYTVSNQLVPSGPFELTNLPLGGGSGDLNVIVHESDGTQQRFVVPYDTPAVSLRQGYFQYAVMGGEYRPANNLVKKNTIGAIEMKYGLPWDLTLYGGLQGAENYQAVAIGVGALLGNLGAVSADVTQSNSKKNNLQKENGQRWRLRYNKSLDSGTAFNITSEGSTTERFDTLSETLDTFCKSKESKKCHSGNKKQKNRLSVSISQAMNDWGMLNLNAYRRNYWHDKSTITSFSVGYSKIFENGVSVNINLSNIKNIDKSGSGKNDKLINFWMSLPFERWISNNSINANYQLTSDSHGESMHEFGVYGDAFERQLHWDIRERYRSKYQDNKASSALSLNYRGTYGEIRSDYSYEKKQRQFGVGVNGNLILTQYGLTAGQSTGDTFALVQASGVDGASVGYWPGMKTDFRGYTSYGFLTPYQENDIEINPITLPVNAEIPQTTTRVVPTKGAVVLAKFNTRIGSRILLRLNRSDNKSIPFGSIATLEGASFSTGIVGENNQVYLTGVSENAKVNVRWGKDRGQSCHANVTLPKHADVAGIYNLTAICKINR